MPEETNVVAAPETTKRKLPMKSIIIIAAIILLEGGLFAAFMMFTGPADATGETTDSATEKVDKFVEIAVAKGRFPNNQNGRWIYYDLEIGIQCDEEQQEKVTKTIEKRSALIRDRLRIIVAEADPQIFDDPTLTTFRRQVERLLTEVVGDDEVKGVLIPKCDPSM